MQDWPNPISGEDICSLQNDVVRLTEELAKTTDTVETLQTLLWEFADTSLEIVTKYMKNREISLGKDPDVSAVVAEYKRICKKIIESI